MQQTHWSAARGRATEPAQLLAKASSTYGPVSSDKYWVTSLSSGAVCYTATSNLHRNRYCNTILKYTLLALGLDGRQRLKNHSKETATATGTLLYSSKTSGKTVT